MFHGNLNIGMARSLNDIRKIIKKAKNPLNSYRYQARSPDETIEKLAKISGMLNPSTIFLKSLISSI